jgi:glycerol-3-phosphate acyltransferase PlsX
MAETPVVFDAATAEEGLPETFRGAAHALTLINRPLDLHLVVYDAKEAEGLAARELLPAAKKCGGKVTFHAATEHLPAKIESPVKIYRSIPGNPITTACKLARQLNGVAISPGNTGLVMAAALFEMGRLPGVDRPPIATPWPTLGKTMFALDSGANVDLRPQHLHQFAHIGKVYVERVYKRPNPVIGLLSNGSEDYKGNSLVREAFKLLSADSSLNFAGYVEGQNFFAGDIDLLVHEGFIGNVLLKFAEGLASTVNKMLRDEIRKSLFAGLATSLFLRPALRRYKKRFDYTEFGGAPLLGVKGNVVICHGRSDANAIKNAIRWGVRMIDENIAEGIEQQLRGRGLDAPDNDAANGAPS